MVTQSEQDLRRVIDAALARIDAKEAAEGKTHVLEARRRRLEATRLKIEAG